jgi:hypothetical protein
MNTISGPVLDDQSRNVQSEPVRQTATLVQRPPRRWWLWVLQQRSTQLALVGWVLIAIAIPLLAGPTLPFDRPALAGQPVATQILNAHSLVLLALVVIAVANLVTPHRVMPDIVARAPARPIAAVEVGLLVAYGVLIQAGGVIVGQFIGTVPLSGHMPGSIYAVSDTITPAQTAVWMTYNFVLYAVIPYLVFRLRGYSNEQLCLTSINKAKDALLIVVVLAFEGSVELGFAGAFWSLNTNQKLIGMALSIVINFFGVVLPVMIYLYAILLPRFLKLSGSIMTTIVLCGLGYTAMHMLDAWTVYDGLRNGALSVMFLLLQYFGPGMVKAVLTLRTGNAWVHALAYHAFAPHAWTDAPLMVRVFGVR